MSSERTSNTGNSRRSKYDWYSKGLAVAGSLLADAPLQEVIERSLACNDAARALGWSGATPFLTLAFLALSVIPSLKITDRGLVDVDRFQLVPLRAE